MFARARAAALVGPAVAVMVACAGLVALGHWQMNRKVWKEDLIAKLEARPKADPVSYAQALDHFAEAHEAEYLRVAVRGTFDHAQERYLFAPTDRELGWDIYTLFKPEGGAPLLFVNRGWVPDALCDPAKRPDGQVPGSVEIVGLARAPASPGWFSAQNDAKGNRWYWRDLAAMRWGADGPPTGATTTHAPQPYAPFALDAEANPPNPGGWPKGGATFVQLSNRHLEYALTWYGLAVALLVIFAVFARQRIRQTGTKAPLQP